MHGKAASMDDVRAALATISAWYFGLSPHSAAWHSRGRRRSEDLATSVIVYPIGCLEQEDANMGKKMSIEMVQAEGVEAKYRLCILDQRREASSMHVLV